MSVVERPRGTRDFDPRRQAVYDGVLSVVRRVFESYGYGRVTTPTFEHVELFTKKSGEDISEHLYVFTDKSERKLCLRPEATASVARFFAQDLRNSPLPLRLWYFAPMFRYERPQKGRYREFWQMGLELLGAKGVESDAEAVLVASDAMKELGLAYRLELNHVGILRGLLTDLSIPVEKHEHILHLIDTGEEKALLDETGSEALASILSLKGGPDIAEKARKTLAIYPTALAGLEELIAVANKLAKAGAPYTLNLGIARGLAYYTGLVFEVRVEGLGAQNQVCGGGRYDNLIELFGGPQTPAVGFAFGFDRIVEALEMQNKLPTTPTPDVLVMAATEELRPIASEVAFTLRRESEHALSVVYDVAGKKLGKNLEYAASAGFKYAVIVGPREWAEGNVVVRDLTSGTEERLTPKKAAEKILRR
ncbi:Histidine--tRNA ligase [uncultured archaeon]|nr:Histidine--tRNA ligase [uncultured archaeon]